MSAKQITIKVQRDDKTYYATASDCPFRVEGQSENEAIGRFVRSTWMDEQFTKYGQVKLLFEIQNQDGVVRPTDLDLS